MEQVLPQRYSAEKEVVPEHGTRGSVSGFLLVLCIPAFAAVMIWAAVASPEAYLSSLMWGQLPL